MKKQKTPELVKENIASCHNIQWSKKIALNSAYGAVGNQYFRYYDVRQASGIQQQASLLLDLLRRK